MPLKHPMIRKQSMVSKQAVVWTLALAMGLGAAPADAQDSAIVKPNPPAAQSSVGAPDACKLLTQADLQALFPGRPVDSKGPTLSPIFKGPQYNESCTYTVKVPNPQSKSELTKFATINVILWGGETDGPRGSAATFANIRSTREKVSADPKINHKIDAIPGLGDEAFLETSQFTITARVRKADLIYVVNLDTYSPQTEPNVIALATQVSKRWKPGTGMVDADAAVAANNSVDIPEDKRQSSAAPADQWPDACALLAPDDIRAVFSDMKIDPPRKTMGQLKSESRIDHVEELPKPMRCVYPTSRTDLVKGEKRFVNHDASLIISNMAANEDLSKRYYQIARKSDGAADVPGVGDEASIDIMNTIVIRKGRLVVQLRVAGGDRDRDIHDDATRRVNELAKRVAAKMTP